MDLHPRTQAQAETPAEREPLGRRMGAEVNRLVEAWLLWVAVGALSGVLVLSPSLSSSADLVPQAAPSAIEIEQAVAQAEAEGIAAGAEIKTRRD